MDSYFSMLILLSIGVIIWQIFAWLRMAGKIIVAGHLPFRRVILVLLLAGITGAVVFRDTMAGEWPYFCVFVLITGIYVIIPAGAGEEGFYYMGRRLSYDRFEYFMVIREFKSGFTLRLHERRTEKDFVVLFKNQDREHLLAILKEHGVHDWDEFIFPSDLND